MSERERLRRPDPARTGPIRNWSMLYRRGEAWRGEAPGGCAPPPGDDPGDARGDTISHAVGLGYQVVQEQIQQGQRIAEQINSRAYDSGAMAGDLREVGDRAWRYFADLGALWVDYLSAIAGDGELMRKLFEAWQPAGAPTTAASGGAAGIAVEIACDRPAQVALAVRDVDARAALICQPLRALETETPPLTDVACERAADGGLTVRIRVPAAQPPGVYIGAVIDAATVQPRGTLRVSLT